MPVNTAVGKSGNKRKDLLTWISGPALARGLFGIAVFVVSAQLPSWQSPEKDPALRGFIVSDDHFGWQHPQQPKPDEIREMMARITRNLPGLDLFLDTGDVHHGNASEQHLGDWTEIVLGGAGPIPFYFSAGNHDIDMFRKDLDVEWRCNRLGSVSCRPYYSFDLKGIHFIVLPELLYMCYITREALDWVKLDLALNRDKTIIFLSHNSIAGTTAYHDDPGYRRLANSREVFDLIDGHPNVLAWMHGHNHTWEIVRKGGKLFVSNGRIGGFDPPYPGYWGKGNLGGIYFEVRKDSLTVRGYSASQEKFFDQMEHYAHLTETLSARTSFDARAPARLSYGMGGARDGQKIPVYHHHALGNGRRELFLAGVSDAVINENPELDVYTERTHPLAPDKHILPGYEIVPHDDERWQWLNPGIKIRARSEGVTTLVLPGPRRGSTTYYRCPPGKKYRVAMDLESPGGGQALQLRCQVHDSKGECLTTLDGPVWTLESGRNALQAEFEIPALSGRDTIYGDSSSDNLLHLLVEAKFSSLIADVAIKRFILAFAHAARDTADPAVVLLGKTYGRKGSMAQGEVARFELPSNGMDAREVYQIKANGNRRLTWLVRETGLSWQVRNAVVRDRGDALEIGPIRNKFSPRRQIVIAPMAPLRVPYPWRLENVDRIAVYPYAVGDRRLRMEIREVLGPARLEIRSDLRPAQVVGVERWEYSGGVLILYTNQSGSIDIRWGSDHAKL